jgi:hypothetical protein
MFIEGIPGTCLPTVYHCYKGGCAMSYWYQIESEEMHSGFLAFDVRDLTAHMQLGSKFPPVHPHDLGVAHKAVILHAALQAAALPTGSLEQYLVKHGLGSEGETDW